MAPNHGLVHLKEYDIKDSNVELIGSDLDHKVKYASAATEPAWNDGHVGLVPGIFVWRIENFAVVPVPKQAYGQFYDGDSYIVLHSQQIKKKKTDPAEETENEPPKLSHTIHFLLGAHTSQDEAGTAAYKTVELDEFLHGAATQHRELQARPSPGFLSLFPRVTFRRGGVASGFRHVPQDEEKDEEEILTLLRVFRNPSTSPGAGADAVIVYEVPAMWTSLDENDVFIVEQGASAGGKIWVWQGKKCSPMEKARAAQVVHDMKLAKRVDVEVVSQAEARSRVVVRMLGGGEEDGFGSLTAERPLVGSRPSSSASSSGGGAAGSRKLFKLSDESGRLEFGLVKENEVVLRGDLDGDDVFVLDDAGRTIWVWEGQGASKAEKATWLRVAQAYVRRLQGEQENGDAYLTPVAKVREGSESTAFLRVIGVA
ncbi:putative actin-binding protein [Dichotomopilus funicola]|uniref:Actin-binding protein n=1 Tax=Dichotomopilus funicola TaxID=1934379 RepID=A0AAN6V278_9PEZI|nr:putative actin-binding protein [Dichotomopilus funicola]